MGKAAGAVRALAEEDFGPASSAAPSAAPMQYQEALRAFGDIAGALNEVEDLDTLLHLIGSRICDLTATRRCSVYLRDKETGYFRGQVGHALYNIDSRIKRLVAGIEADRFTREIVETKRPVFLSNPLEDPRPIRSVMRDWNVRSMLGVPMVHRGEVIGLVYLDAEDERCSFTDEEVEFASVFANLAAAAISQAQLTGDLRRTLAKVARQNKILRLASGVDDRLSRLVLDGAGFNEIAAAVAELTAKPCGIYDHEYRVRATAEPPGTDHDGAARVPDASWWAAPAVKEALDQLGDEHTGILDRIPDAGLWRRMLVAPVVSHGRSEGTLVVMEHGSLFGALDAHIARRAATHIALEMAAERRAARAEWDARASLLAELIRGNRDVPSLERRADYLGLDLAAPRVLCLVGPASRDAGIPVAAAITAAITAGGRGGTAFVTGVAEGLLVATDLDPALPVQEAVRHARSQVEQGLRQLRADFELIASISTCCRRPSEYVRAYSEVKDVMRCLTSVADVAATPVLCADDLGPARLFLASSDRTEAQRFALDALGALLSDEEGMPDLLRTLHVFFQDSRSVRRSAQVLGVHENTIRYRLARVEKLTGLAVASSSADQLTVQLALLIVQISGWTRADAVGSGPPA